MAKKKLKGIKRIDKIVNRYLKEKFGIKAYYQGEDIVVEKGILQTPKGILDGYNDHRIVMSLAVLCTVTGGKIYGAEAVSKSFPDFFERFSSLGIDLGCQE